MSAERHARANASELLDALLRRRDQQRLRALLRIIADDLPAAERVARAAKLLGRVPPRTRSEALLELVDGSNRIAASLTAQYALATGGAAIRVVEAALERRPDIDVTSSRFFEDNRAMAVQRAAQRHASSGAESAESDGRSERRDEESHG